MKRLLGLIRKAPWHFFAVAALNVDWVVMPILRLLGVKGWLLFGICAVAVSLEFQYWFWLTGTTLKNPTRFQYLVYSFIEFLNGWTVDAANLANEYVNGTLKALGWVISHLAMVVCGAMPSVLIWGPGLVFCRVKRWTGGYGAMAVGNILKVAYFMFGWKTVLEFFCGGAQ